MPAEAIVQPPTEQPQTPPAPPPSDTPPKSQEPDFGSADDPDLKAAFDSQDDGLRVEQPKKDDKAPEPKAGEPKAGEVKQDDPKGEEGKVDPNDPRLPKGFRKELQRVSEEKANLQKTAEKLQTRLAELEKQTGDSTAMTKVMETQKEQIKQLSEELGKLRFEKSDDYKERYEKPFNKAAKYARSLVEELEVIETDSSDMTSTRPAKWDDFLNVWTIRHGPKGAAFATLHKMFGPAAPAVIEQFNRLKQLDSEMTEALSEERQSWENKQLESRASEAASQKAIQEAWQKTNDEIAAKHPEWFAKDESDPKADELQTSATKIADHFFNNRHRMKPEDILLVEAQMRNRFIAMPRVQRKVTMLEAKLKELESELNGYREADPNGELRRAGGGGGGPKNVDDPEAEYRDLLKQAFN